MKFKLKAEQRAQQERNEETMRKLERSKQLVQQHQQEQAHQNMLKQEARKLKVDDISKLVQRTARQENQKKLQIIQENINQQLQLETFRNRRRSMINQSVISQFQHTKIKHELKQELHHFAKSDFRSPTTAAKIWIQQSPSIAHLIKSINNGPQI